MKKSANRWVLVLAAGSGTRLESLTTLGKGRSIPKQFCSLNGGISLLEETLERAFSITAPERVIVVVASEHEPFWRDALREIPRENVVVQPRNRGTAIGILIGIASMLVRDPAARAVILPSDHYVPRKRVLERCILRTLAALDENSNLISFLGIEPDRADRELGYIVRGASNGSGGYRIAEFVEKPGEERVQDLMQKAALWNSFILVATARSFIDLVSERYATIANAFLEVTADVGARDASTLDNLYLELPSIDFSRDVVEGADASLSVVPVPACGWTDLGTPGRVAACLNRLENPPPRIGAARLSLADAYSRLQEISAMTGQWA